MRQAVGRWLRAAEAGEDEIYEMLVASGEAWSNAVAHAHPATSDEPFRLQAPAAARRSRSPSATRASGDHRPLRRDRDGGWR